MDPTSAGLAGDQCSASAVPVTDGGRLAGDAENTIRRRGRGLSLRVNCAPRPPSSSLSSGHHVELHVRVLTFAGAKAVWRGVRSTTTDRFSCSPTRSCTRLLVGTNKTRVTSEAECGDSAGAPQWAAIIALANELRARQVRGPLGLVSPVLYDIAQNPRSYSRDFHDITSGTNTLDLSPFGLPPSQFGFAAQPGYDLATGLGTPDVSNLISDLSRRGSGEIPGNLRRFLKQDGKDHGKHHSFDPSK